MRELASVVGGKGDQIRTYQQKTSERIRLVMDDLYIQFSRARADPSEIGSAAEDVTELLHVLSSACDVVPSDESC